MKKLIVIFLGFLALALAGCGSDSSTPPIPPAGGGAVTPPPAGVATALAPLSGGTQATPVAVNDAGLIVGNSEPTPGTPMKAVTWSAAGGPATQLPALAGAPANSFSAAHGVNEAGAIVGEAQDGPASFFAVVWPSSTAVPVALPRLGAATTFSTAFDVNAGGAIVGEAENNAFDRRAVLWTSSAANPVDLGTLKGGKTSTAYAINDTGFIAGESDDAAGKLHAVVWEPNGNVHTIVDLGIVAETGSTANDISAVGVVVGETEATPGLIQAVAWIPGAPGGPYSRRDMGIASTESAANGIKGNKVVGYSSTLGGNEAVTWDVTSATPTLASQVPGTTPPSQAYAANTTGMIVGKAGTGGFVTGP
jgi:probable HAF family extracellular repeat protein